MFVDPAPPPPLKRTVASNLLEFWHVHFSPPLHRQSHSRPSENRATTRSGPISTASACPYSFSFSPSTFDRFLLSFSSSWCFPLITRDTRLHWPLISFFAVSLPCTELHRTAPHMEIHSSEAVNIYSGSSANATTTDKAPQSFT